ncbi:nuclear transport factor 2 family protein [Arthrobacter oryzae]|uniref:nuclear transport factor 2 family protein n=1 Tax=Arthrobacter oryzae TaxID=409290 RepID=UPI00286325C4|nr:nuclear transport factor 2 family protein [Arthrobacter oryzae]MDR6505129.1 ketosteroid isomerase-like protein [Arthrobacter oryzae]
MGSQENIDLVRRGYDAFGAGDMATLGELFNDDAVWHVGGSGALSGDKSGRDAILAYFGELVSRSGGTVKVTLDDVVGGDNHTVGVQRNHAERDGKAMDQRAALVFTIRDGKVAEVYEFLEDTARNDEFWS